MHSKQKEELERRLKELEEQEALIESNSSGSTSHLTTDLTTSSSLGEAHSVTATLASDESGCMGGVERVTQPTQFDLAQAIEERKREIASRLGLDFAAQPPPPPPVSHLNVAAAVTTGVFSSDSGFGGSLSGTVSVAAAAAQRKIATTRTASFSSSCSTMEGASSLASSSAALLIKKPINLAVEQLNSEILGSLCSIFHGGLFCLRVQKEASF